MVPLKKLVEKTDVSAAGRPPPTPTIVPGPIQPSAAPASHPRACLQRVDALRFAAEFKLRIGAALLCIQFNYIMIIL